MSNTLVFLHTAPLHIATFDRLLDGAGADVPVRHLVDEQLLADARAGGMSSELAGRIEDVVNDAMVGDSGVLVCTCSTIGAAVEQAGQAAGLQVVRVDRAMAEQAVLLGPRIMVVAALASTLEPTRELLLETARQHSQQIELSEALCADAWRLFEQNELVAFHRAIAACLKSSYDGADVVVLAQASMAGAADLCRDLAVPVLSSPRLGLEAALRVYRAEGMRDAT